MEFETVRIWLTNHTNKQIRNRWLLALLGFVLLPVGTVVGGLLIYVFLLAATHNRGEPFDPAMKVRCFWIALGILLVTFIVNLFISGKREPEKFYHDDAGDDGSFVGHYRSRQMAKYKFFLWFIMTGPRLLSWSIFSLQEVSRLKKQDTHSCSALLWLLMTSRVRVTYELIPQQLDWLDLQATLPQIAELEGVVFLKTPPLGLSITDDLRTAIRTGVPL